MVRCTSGLVPGLHVVFFVPTPSHLCALVVGRFYDDALHITDDDDVTERLSNSLQ